MQPPTCVNLRVNTPAEALVICHAVYLGKLRMITRRLDTDERRAINSGNVYVWEERGSSSDASGMSSIGIERWTDSISWGPSRVRDEFLYYQERRPAQPEFDTTSTSDSDSAPTYVRRGNYQQRQSLIKQTYSVFVETPHGQRKWHLIAYFTAQTLEQLQTIHHRPVLSTLVVPPEMYRPARCSKIPRSRQKRGTIGQLNERPDALGPLNPLWPDHTPPPSLASTRIEERGPKTLAPLAFLQTRPPPNRHVMDEAAIMSLLPTFNWKPNGNATSSSGCVNHSVL